VPESWSLFESTVFSASRFRARWSAVAALLGQALAPKDELIDLLEVLRVRGEALMFLREYMLFDVVELDPAVLTVARLLVLFAFWRSWTPGSYHSSRSSIGRPDPKPLVDADAPSYPT